MEVDFIFRLLFLPLLSIELSFLTSLPEQQNTYNLIDFINGIWTNSNSPFFTLFSLKILVITKVMSAFFDSIVLKMTDFDYRPTSFIKKLFKNTLMVDLKVFFTQQPPFYRRVALLCSSKNEATGRKIQFNSPHQTFLNNFIKIIAKIEIFFEREGSMHLALFASLLNCFIVRRKQLDLSYLTMKL